MHSHHVSPQRHIMEFRCVGPVLTFRPSYGRSIEHNSCLRQLPPTPLLSPSIPWMMGRVHALVITPLYWRCHLHLQLWIPLDWQTNQFHG